MRHLEAKAAGLLLLLALLLCSAIGYLLYARGAFEPTQRLVLVADDAEGVTVGMDLTFSGFPIGRVQRIELSPAGNARILINVPKKDARWLRSSSIFTLVRGILGNTNLRAYSGQLSDPELPDNAERRVLAGDAAAELPQMLAAVRELVQRVSSLAAPNAALAGSLANLQAVTDQLTGPRGALGLLMGNEADAKKLLTTLDRTNALLLRADALTASLDRLAGKTDAQVFGAQGLLPETRATVLQLNALLGDARSHADPGGRRAGRSARHRQQHPQRHHRPGRAARRGGSQPAQGAATGRRDQPQVAVRPRHRAEVAMSGPTTPWAATAGARLRMRACTSLLAAAALLAGCASRPGPTDWQLSARAALDQAMAAELRGDSRIAALEFDRARSALARTGRPDLLARAELLRCAALQASLQLEPCAPFERLRADAAAPELAYADHLAGRLQAAQAPLLPPAQQVVAALGPGTTDSAAAAALQGLADPLSRLVGAAVLLRSGRAGPAVTGLAVDTASAQGWRRPLLAWLGLQLQQAQAAGDSATAARLQRRIDVAGGPR